MNNINDTNDNKNKENNNENDKINDIMMKKWISMIITKIIVMIF